MAEKRFTIEVEDRDGMWAANVVADDLPRIKEARSAALGIVLAALAADVEAALAAESDDPGSWMWNRYKNRTIGQVRSGGHSEPRAEWPDETEARVASILHQEDCPCTSPVHEADYLDTARIVLSSIEAVPIESHNLMLMDATRMRREKESAEFQLATYRTALERLQSMAEARIRNPDAADRETLALARAALGGPDDAPKEPKTVTGTDV